MNYPGVSGRLLIPSWWHVGTLDEDLGETGWCGGNRKAGPWPDLGERPLPGVRPSQEGLKNGGESLGGGVDSSCRCPKAAETKASQPVVGGVELKVSGEAGAVGIDGPCGA